MLQIPERFRAKWVPVEENASNQKTRAPFDSMRTEKVLVFGGRGVARGIRSSALTTARCFFRHDLWLEK